MRPARDSGSASAEFAIVVPILLLLLFVMVTLASVFFDQLHLQAAARDAARVGVVNLGAACSTAQNALTNNSIGNVVCTIISDCGSGAVRVGLAATSDYSVPALGDRSITLSATSSFVCPQ
jgi:Flp pilus assembly protein TadG